jgi:plastocyanin
MPLRIITRSTLINDAPIGHVKYRYICSLHDFLGMKGTVFVLP